MCTLFQPSDVDELSDEQILDLAKNAPALLPDYAIYRLTPGTVAKPSQELEDDPPDAPEANTLELVLAKTTIPVPRVRRVVKQKWDYLIVMDYIKGPTLAQVWSGLPLWRKIYIAFTLRRYVRQLRRLTASPATPVGPLSNHGPRGCESPIFGQVQSRRGPFASYAELSAYFNEGHKIVLDRDHHAPDDHPSRKELFDDSAPLVLTHQDLNPRNIILGDDGRLWVVDWAWAGYYPRWFEYVAMRRQAENEETIGSHHVLWEAFIPFICGPCFIQERWLRNMSQGLEYLR